MRRTAVWSGIIGACLILGITGCTGGGEAPGYTGIHRMTGLDGRPEIPEIPDGLISPVMQDVYDRSIPEEVYSVQ